MAFTTVTALWQGATGLPGYTRLRWSGAQTASGAGAIAANMRTFFDSIKSLLPVAVTISFGEVAQIFDTDGSLIDEVAVTPLPSPVVGTSATNFAAPAGAVLNWVTGEFVSGRRVRGRTFLVPLAQSAFQGDGTISTAALSLLTTSATTLIGSNPNNLVVWRHTPPRSVHAVTGVSVPDRAAVLRSRRS